MEYYESEIPSRCELRNSTFVEEPCFSSGSESLSLFVTYIRNELRRQAPLAFVHMFHRDIGCRSEILLYFQVRAMFCRTHIEWAYSRM